MAKLSTSYRLGAGRQSRKPQATDGGAAPQSRSCNGLMRMMERGQLSHAEGRAALEILRAGELLMRVGEPQALSWSVMALPGARAPLPARGNGCLELGVDLRQRLQRWMACLTSQGEPTEELLRDITGQSSLNATDRRLKRRNGYTRKRLIAALRLYGCIDATLARKSVEQSQSTCQRE